MYGDNDFRFKHCPDLIFRLWPGSIFRRVLFRDLLVDFYIYSPP